MAEQPWQKDCFSRTGETGNPYLKDLFAPRQSIPSTVSCPNPHPIEDKEDKAFIAWRDSLPKVSQKNRKKFTWEEVQKNLPDPIQQFLDRSILDDRHIRASWPEAAINFCKQHEVSRLLHKKLDYLMRHQGLLYDLCRCYTFYEKLELSNFLSDNALSYKDFSEYMFKTYGIKFFNNISGLHYFCFTIESLPDYIIKIPKLPMRLYRWSDHSTLKRIFNAQLIKERWEKLQINNKIKLVVPEKFCYLPHKDDNMPYQITPKIIIVSKKIKNLDDMVHITSKHSHSEAENIIENLIKCGHRDIGGWGNVHYNPSTCEVILTDTKSINDYGEFMRTMGFNAYISYSEDEDLSIHKSFLSPFGLMATQKKPIA